MPTDQNGNNITSAQQIMASGSGAILTSLFMTPLDVVKIRMQSEKINAKCFMYCNGLMDHLCYCLNGNGNGNGKRKWYKRPSSFNSTFHGMMQIAKNEGITSLWSGLSPTLVMAIPATVMYFTMYDQLRDYLFQKQYVSKEYAPVMAGAAARAGTVTVISPLELVRTKMQSKKLSTQEVKTAIKSTIEVGGWRAMWIGLGPTLMRDVPFSMVYWYLLEYLKRRIKMESVFIKSFSCGFIAGLVAGIVTLPLDVVKTKRQITLGELEILGVYAKKDGTTTLAVMKKIIRESGVRGLFVGLIPRCAKVAPACAIMIGSYDVAKRFFHKRNEKKNRNSNSARASSMDNISSTYHSSTCG